MVLTIQTPKIRKTESLKKAQNGNIEIDAGSV
jgi:hypothetical protein